MPHARLCYLLSTLPRFLHRPAPWSTAVGLVFVLGSTSLSAPTTIRARDIELHYRLSGATNKAQVELWYTRDRGVTWQSYGIDPDGRSPLLFTAPAEGLYGFTLIAHDGARVSAPPPNGHQQPHRWVFIDYTPPLVQWSTIEPGDDFANKRTVQLRWIAHDDHLTNRPITLAYQSSVDQQWRVIESQLPNVGRYDWVVPAGIAGQVTLKLAVYDQGGHVVERQYGPVPVTAWEKAVDTSASAVAEVPDANAAGTTTAPASELAATRRGLTISLSERRKAEELYEQGSAYLLRGEYAIAAARLSEALEHDPEMLKAMNDLAGIYYLQEDYDKALNFYNKIIDIDGNYQSALSGAALAYVAKRQYAKSRDILEKLLAANETDAASLLDLGDVLEFMGDRTGARQHWQRATTADASAKAIILKARQRLKDFRPATATDIPAVASGKR